VVAQAAMAVMAAAQRVAPVPLSSALAAKPSVAPVPPSALAVSAAAALPGRADVAPAASGAWAPRLQHHWR